MSAFLVATRAGRIDVLADSAHYTPELVLTDTRSKVHELPGAAVVTGRGAIGFIDAFAAVAPTCVATFDELVAGFPDIMAAVEQAVAEPPDYEILLAGWSEAQGVPLVLFMAGSAESGAVEGGSFEPRAIYRCGDLFGAGPPGPLAELCERFRGAVEEFDPATDGLAAFKALRATPVSLSKGDGYSVGGFLELVTIRREGIEREVLRVWLGLGLNQTQKATIAARATAERKLAASLS